MLFPDPAAQSLWASVIMLGAKQASAKELRVALDAGRRAKPLRFDETVSGMAQRYRGDQQEIIRAALSRRYPHAGEMPINPINWLAFWARSDAGVYVADAERFLEARDGTEVARDDPRAVGLARALDDLGLQTVMPELERRVLTGVKSAVVELGWRKADEADEGTPVANLYWPSDVSVICHPSAPNDDRSIMVCALRQTAASAGPDVETWWVWSRQPTENLDGSVKSWGPWFHVRISTDGKHASLPVEYPGKLLPICFLRLEQADGGFWPMPERDTIVQVDELNIGRSNEQHTVDLQAHGQAVYEGNSLEMEDILTGPDRVIKVGLGETFTAVNFQPHLEEMSATRAGMLREVAVSRSNNTDAYATTPTVAVSGISRAIANLPHDQRVRELRPIFRRFEEKRLLPVVLEHLELFAGYYPEQTGDLVPRVAFGVPKDYEELDAKQRRHAEDLKLGAINLPRYCVLMGLDENEVAAATRLATMAAAAAGADPTASPAVPPPGETAPATTSDLTAQPTETVQDTALNGAQTDALIALAEKAAAKALPADTVEVILSMAFPAIPEPKIKRLLSTLKGFEPPPLEGGPSPPPEG